MNGTKPRRGWILPAAMALAVALSLLAPAKAADADTTPPRLRAVRVEPAVVDVSAADATVTVTATVTDEGTGVNDFGMFVSFRQPSGGSYASTSLQRTAGDEFSGEVRIAAGSLAGVWRLDSFSASDRAGNFRSIAGSTLVALGFTASFEVRSAGGGDGTPPRLRALSMDPSVVDVSTGDATATVTATVTDDGTGVDDRSVWITFQPPAGVALASVSLQRTAGDVFTGVLSIRAGSQAGPWRVLHFGAGDRAGNQRAIGGPTLLALGFANSLEVWSAGGGDGTPPRLRTLSVDPAVVDVSAGSATVTVTATVTDAGTGVEEPVRVSFRSSSGGGEVGLGRTAGDEFRGVLHLAAGSPTGVWRLDSVDVRDRAGNIRWITGSTLVALGFTTSFRVGTAPDPPPADTAAPRVSGLRLTPASVDVRDEPATVTLTATITDETGISSASFALRSPTGTQSFWGSLSRTGGDEFTGSLMLPQGSASGRWQLGSLSLSDTIGNSVGLSRFDIAELGFEAVTVEVTGRDTVDAAPPRLLAVRLTPASVDVRDEPATVTLTATITDETGISGASFALRSPTGTSSLWGSLWRTDGDEFAGSVQLPQGAATGRWQLDSFLLSDQVGNSANLSRFDLADLGLEGLELEVTGRETPDATPPRVSALRLTPASVDVRDGPATVTLTATITDETGISSAFFALRSPTGAPWLSGSLWRTGGDEFAGTVELPQGAATGRWQLEQLMLNDTAGNNVYLNRFDLADLGFEDLGVDATTVKVSGQGRFGSDGDGQVMFSLSNDAVRLERIRGQRFAFAGDVASISGAGKAATLRGTGAWNGEAGYTFELSVVDNASWGRLEDTIDVVIRDPAGATVFTSGGRQVLKQGDVVVTPPASG
jgi:hypothetical protein